MPTTLFPAASTLTANRDDLAEDQVINLSASADWATHERRMKKRLRKELRYLAGMDRVTEKARAKRAALEQEEILEDEHGDDDFTKWNSNRALDRRDFDYLFFHRANFMPQITEWLEIINSKVRHVCADGRDGYFTKLERNVGWTRYVGPLLFTRAEIVDKLVRCGVWSHAKNSRRCHKAEFCPNCLWNDVIKVLVSAFGKDSGAFPAARAWWFITVGWTNNLNNAKCVTGDFNPDCLLPPSGDRGYDPYPTVLGVADDDADGEWLGCEDARRLGVLMQQAVRSLYKQDIIDGYHFKLEGSFRLNPGGATRVNFHSHTVANGSEDSAKFLANQLYEALVDARSKYCPELNQRHYPDIQVKRITSAEHLEKAIVYSEKVVPLHHMVEDAMGRPEAKLPDGTWNAEFIEKLNGSLCRLLDDDLPALFSGVLLEEGMPRLFRRKTVGNISFDDRGFCIGDEPDWHKKARRRRAKRQKEARALKKQQLGPL